MASTVKTRWETENNAESLCAACFGTGTLVDQGSLLALNTMNRSHLRLARHGDWGLSPGDVRACSASTSSHHPAAVGGEQRRDYLIGRLWVCRAGLQRLRWDDIEENVCAGDCSVTHLPESMLIS